MNSRNAPGKKASVFEAGLLGLISALLLLLTFMRNGLWVEDARIWADAAEKSPQKARTHNNLGVALAGQGRYKEATGHIKRAIEINPFYPEFYNILGLAYVKSGQIERAQSEFEEILIKSEAMAREGGLEPRFTAMAHTVLGNIYSLKGMNEKAIYHYREALELGGGGIPLHYNLGLAYKEAGKIDEAVKEFEGVLNIYPGHEKAMLNISVLKREKHEENYQ